MPRSAADGRQNLCVCVEVVESAIVPAFNYRQRCKLSEIHAKLRHGRVAVAPSASKRWKIWLKSLARKKRMPGRAVGISVDNASAGSSHILRRRLLPPEVVCQRYNARPRSNEVVDGEDVLWVAPTTRVAWASQHHPHSAAMSSHLSSTLPHATRRVPLDTVIVAK